MKKIMLSSLVLLPLIVLLILTLGGMVVSKTSYIYVEKVEFTESDVLVLIKDGDEDPTAQLSVNVLPLRATDKSVVFPATTRASSRSVRTASSRVWITVRRSCGSLPRLTAQSLRCAACW